MPGPWNRPTGMAPQTPANRSTESGHDWGSPGDGPALVGLGVGGGAAVAALGALLVLRRRRSV